jgi:hypothetical protein
MTSTQAGRMRKERATTQVDRPADEVWATIRDFGDLTWFPGVESCTHDGDTRWIRMLGLDLDVVERQVSVDHELRTYTYRLVGELDVPPAFPGGPARRIHGLEATLSVHPRDGDDGDAVSTVVYDVETDDDIVDGTRDGYQHAIDHLKAQLER